MKGERLIYADHAATAPLSAAAWEAMTPWLRDGCGNPSSRHSFGVRARRAVEEARAVVAACIGARLEEIFFTSGGTEANNWILSGCGRARIGVGAIEHHAVLRTAERIAARGRTRTAVVEVEPDGRYSRDALRALVAAQPDGGFLVSLMSANNEIGTVQDVAALAEIVHARGGRFHTDAVQAVGHIPVDVNRWGVDALSASAHKFGGPQGVGFLFARDMPLAPLLSGGGQERGQRAGTENVAGIVGLAAALRDACAEMADRTRRLDELTETFTRDVRARIPGAVFICADTPKLPGFVSVAFPGHPAEGMLHLLDLKGIAVSSGSACNSRSTEISHVLRAIQAPRAVAESTLRVTFGPENTLDEVAAIVAALKLG